MGPASLMGGSPVLDSQCNQMWRALLWKPSLHPRRHPALRAGAGYRAGGPCGRRHHQPPEPGLLSAAATAGSTESERRAQLINNKVCLPASSSLGCSVDQRVRHMTEACRPLACADVWAAVA